MITVFVNPLTEEIYGVIFKRRRRDRVYFHVGRASIERLRNSFLSRRRAFLIIQCLADPRFVLECYQRYGGGRSLGLSNTNKVSMLSERP